ncbi:LysR family transcriptional regulator [Thermomonospora cellulosilytica]|uniref:DNA-binding transcriptional LysR family regulator n=1 Tax=Thermomonospora cellulosilytica TaxID=1411118 RepID=A0A7W3N2E9_9ACTN|nr:LysR family transcriptional regulator [Thermomonospora cellulosilytica]MBA9006310.1 DNA-binding transcriptional LysR family regulator [Thermomonospora cellulosilytica]
MDRRMRHGAGDGERAPAAGPEPTVHQLRLLMAVAQELHFGRAAARLHMTQPALSRQIRTLEHHLGVRLFDRTSRVVEPTAACRALLAEAEVVVAAMDRLVRTARGHSRELGGHLIVGTIGAEASMPHAQAILRELRRRHPRITVELRNLNFADHMNRLLDGEVDVALFRPPAPPGIQMLEICTEARLACLSATDPLADRPRIRLADLADRPVVAVPPHVPRMWWDFWVVNPRPDGSAVRPGPVVTDMEGLLYVVAEGTAIAFVPAAARRFFDRPGVVYVEVTDLPPCSSALAWTTARRDHPMVNAIRAVAGDYVAARTTRPIRRSTRTRG